MVCLFRVLVCVFLNVFFECVGVLAVFIPIVSISCYYSLRCCNFCVCACFVCLVVCVCVCLFVFERLCVVVCACVCLCAFVVFFFFFFSCVCA